MLRQLLHSPRIAGIRVHGQLHYPGNFPAIITADEWELLQVALTRLKQSYPAGLGVEGRTYLLTGLLYCGNGNCENAMVGHTHRDNPSVPPKRRYVCDRIIGRNKQGCGRLYRLAEPLEAFVTEAVLHLVERSGLPVIASPSSADTKGLLQQYQKLRSRRSDLRHDYATGFLKPEEYAEARAMLESEIEEIQTKLARMQPGAASDNLIPAGKSVREAWEEGSFGWRRLFLARVIIRVIVKPNPRRGARWREFNFDTDAIVIIWRG